MGASDGPSFWHMLKALILLMLAAPLAAQTSVSLPRTTVELVSETRAPAAGQNFTLGIVMTPRTNWHTYWEHPGDSGMPTRAVWTLPEGATASDLRYPVPETFVVSGIMNHVYSSENILLANVSVPAGITGNFPVSLKLDWLVCDENLCVPEQAELSLTLPIGDGKADPAQQQLFAKARNALPRQLSEQGVFSVEGTNLRISIPIGNSQTVTGAHFFPQSDDSLKFAAPQTIRRTDNSLIIEAAAITPNTIPTEIPGLLRVEHGNDVEGYELVAIPGTVPAGEPLSQTASSMPLVQFLSIFGLAVLGGLVLNLMPCVFPILSLKAMSLARAGTSQAVARTEGFAYSAGVILVCTALGGIAIAIAKAGAGAGWAFQLQDPRVILTLFLLVFAIGLNLAGLFQINVQVRSGQGLMEKSGAAGAFWTGTLAAFIATPCTGPFMAGALGAALVLPWVAGLSVFAGLGLGIALPFLAIGLFPPLRKWLPKPGNWMVTFQKILAVPMLITAFALAWVLGRQTGASGLTLGLGFALLMGLALWWTGLRQAHGRHALIPALIALFVAISAPATLARISVEDSSSPRSQVNSHLSAIPFSTKKLAELRSGGTPVFLYFTADWCLTCKVNEHGALSSNRVAGHFAAEGVQVMLGDWTRPDPDIAHFLEERGRAGIPLYLYYPPNKEPVELPQLLTTDMLTTLAS